MISIPNEESDENTRDKFNIAIGVPKDANDYPVNELFDDENIRKKFHEIGLSTKQVENLYLIAEEFLSPVFSDVLKSQFEEKAFAELITFF